MIIADIINVLETKAPPSLQESYDNAGLLTGDPDAPCTGALVCLDVVDAVLEEALEKGCNLIIAHHPLIFRGLKRISRQDPVGRLVIRAIQKEIAIYAIHTNLDNVIGGVNGMLADTLQLLDRRVLLPKEKQLRKLVCYVPLSHVEGVRQAIFNAGGGQIGNYTDCSFRTEGVGSFRAGEGTDPYVGEIGALHEEAESRLEVIYPPHLEKKILPAMFAAHPYEEVAYDLISLENSHAGIGAGLIGNLPEPVAAGDFLRRIRALFRIPAIRHTALPAAPLQRVAVCGGAGSFLIERALAAGADVYLTADLKYHEFFAPDGRMLLADIGHYESEQFTSDLICRLIKEKFTTFAVLKSSVSTNPVNYFI